MGGNAGSKEKSTLLYFNVFRKAKEVHQVRGNGFQLKILLSFNITNWNRVLLVFVIHQEVGDLMDQMFRNPVPVEGK